MAAKNSTENQVVEGETAEEAKVPHQAGKPDLELVPAVEGDTPSLSDRAKNMLRNKRFLAGVSSVVLIAVGAAVIRIRNQNSAEDEITTD